MRRTDAEFLGASTGVGGLFQRQLWFRRLRWLVRPRSGQPTRDAAMRCRICTPVVASAPHHCSTRYLISDFARCRGSHTKAAPVLAGSLWSCPLSEWRLGALCPRVGQVAGPAGRMNQVLLGAARENGILLARFP